MRFGWKRVVPVLGAVVVTVVMAAPAYASVPAKTIDKSASFTIIYPTFTTTGVDPGNNPQAGKITSASDYGYNPSERIIQFGLKYNF